MRRLALLVPIALLGAATACADPDENPEFTFAFTSIAEPGSIDQTLTIHNPTDEDFTTTFTITPLDADGEPVQGVEATTAYGSDQGEMVMLPGDNIDVVVLTGDNVHDVEDVEIGEVETEELNHPTINNPISIDQWSNYDRYLTIDNRNKPVTVGVVLLVYDLPESGEPQQVTEVVEILPPTPLERGRDQYVDLSDEALDALHEYTFSQPTSLKTYFAPPAAPPTD
jgi:hypothetical protein